MAILPGTRVDQTQQVIANNLQKHQDMDPKFLNLDFRRLVVAQQEMLIPEISMRQRAPRTSFLQKVWKYVMKYIECIKYYLFNLPDFETQKLQKKMVEVLSFSKQEINYFVQQNPQKQTTTVEAVKTNLQRLKRFALRIVESSSYPSFLKSAEKKLSCLVDNFEQQWDAKTIRNYWLQSFSQELDEQFIRNFFVIPRITVADKSYGWNWNWKKIQELCSLCEESAKIDTVEHKLADEKNSLQKTPILQLRMLYTFLQKILNQPKWFDYLYSLDPAVPIQVRKAPLKLRHEFIKEEGCLFNDARKVAQMLEQVYARQAMQRLSSQLSSALTKIHQRQLKNITEGKGADSTELSKIIPIVSPMGSPHKLLTETMWNKEELQKILRDNKSALKKKTLQILRELLISQITTLENTLDYFIEDTPEMFKRVTKQKLEETIRIFKENLWETFCTVHNSYSPLNLRVVDPQKHWLEGITTLLPNISLPNWIIKYSPVSLRKIIDANNPLFSEDHKKNLAAKYKNKDFASFYFFFTQRFLDCFEIDRNGGLIVTQDPQQLLDNNINKNHWPIFLNKAHEAIEKLLEASPVADDRKTILELYKKAIETLDLYKSQENFRPTTTIGVNPLPPPEKERLKNYKKCFFNDHYILGIWKNSDVSPTKEEIRALTAFLIKKHSEVVFPLFGEYIVDNEQPLSTLIDNIFHILYEQCKKSYPTYLQNLYKLIQTVYKMEEREDCSEETILYQFLRLHLSLKSSIRQDTFAQLLQIQLEQLRWAVLEKITNEPVIQKSHPLSNKNEQYQKERGFLYILKDLGKALGVENLGISVDTSSLEWSDNKEQNKQNFLRLILQRFHTAYNVKKVLQLMRKTVEKSPENALLFTKQLRELGIHYNGDPAHANDFVYLQFLSKTRIINLKNKDSQERYSSGSGTAEDRKVSVM